MAQILEGLLYRSRLVSRIGPLHMCLLVERARQANRAAGITGRLIYLDQQVLQYLEGPTAALNALFSKLQRDPRHTDIEVLARFPLAQRRCLDAPMAFLGNAYFQQYQLRGFSTIQPGDIEALLQSCVA